MRKVLLLIIVIAILAFPCLSCKSESISADASQTEELIAQTDAQPQGTFRVVRDKPPDRTPWINPALVNIGSFRLGATAEWVLNVHNGIEYAVDVKRVGTDPNETSALIPLNRTIYGNWADGTAAMIDKMNIAVGGGVSSANITLNYKPKNILRAVSNGKPLEVTRFKDMEPTIELSGFVSGEEIQELSVEYVYYGMYVASGNTSETLTVSNLVDGDTSANISGFAPDNPQRVITITYLCYNTIGIEYRTPSNTMVGYAKPPVDLVKKWVSISDSLPVLAPNETKTINMSLVMPETLEEGSTVYWEITQDGRNYLQARKDEALKLLYYQILSDNKDYQTATDIDKKKNYEEKAAFAAVAGLNDYIDGVPETKLLTYLAKYGSISTNYAYEGVPGAGSILLEFKEEGLVISNDLLSQPWEFWISVMDKTDAKDKIVTELCARVQVAMR